MPEAKKQPKPTSKMVDLDRLSQADVARLIDRPTSFVREHANWFERDGDGRYSGRQVVAAMLAKASAEVVPLELDEADRHVMHMAFGGYLGDLPYLHPLGRIVERLVGERGDQVLTELGRVVFAAIRREIHLGEETITPGSGPIDREILELQAQEWIEKQLRDARDDKYRRAGRVVPSVNTAAAGSGLASGGRVRPLQDISPSNAPATSAWPKACTEPPPRRAPRRNSHPADGGRLNDARFSLYFEGLRRSAAIPAADQRAGEEDGRPLQGRRPRGIGVGARHPESV